MQVQTQVSSYTSRKNYLRDKTLGVEIIFVAQVIFAQYSKAIVVHNRPGKKKLKTLGDEDIRRERGPCTTNWICIAKSVGEKCNKMKI